MVVGFELQILRGSSFAVTKPLYLCFGTPKTWMSEDAGSSNNLVPVLQREVGADLELQTSSDNCVPPPSGK